MYEMRKALAGFIVAALAVAGLAGCGGDSGSPTITPIAAQPTATAPAPATQDPGTTDPAETAEPAGTTEPAMTIEPTTGMIEPTTGTSGGTATGPAADLIKRSEQAMKGVQSYHASFTIEASGATTQMEADFVPPDRSRMVIDAGELGKTEFIVIGQEAYTLVPGTDSYVLVPTGAPEAPDATSVLPFASNAEIVGDETIDGVDTTHIRFSYDQDKAIGEGAGETGTPVTGQTLGMATADMWIEKSTGFIRKYTLVTDTGTTTMLFSRYNEPINPPIEKPTNIMTMPGLETAPTVAP